MKEIRYNRENAVNYAITWAVKRNPLYYDFSKIGGDCTNFASQTLFAGSKIMNHIPILGWYYLSPTDRTASWTGVEYFNKFIINNTDIGPFGENSKINNIELGDFIQLKNNAEPYHHTLIVTKIEENNIFVCAHSKDALFISLDNYSYTSLRCIHILGVRTP